MLRGRLCALVFLVPSGMGLCQQPPSEPSPTPANQESQQTPPAGTNPRPDEIAELKATVGQLQDRLNRIAPSEEETGGKSRWPLNAFWQDGLQVESQNEMFRIHVGGTLQVDSGWNAAPRAVEAGIGELQDGGLLRRARIRIDGTLYEHIDWIAEYDFANTVENDNGTST
jgi:hypothetical protein